MASPLPAEVSVPIYAAAPLPPGWTEHRAPTGQFYYYHADSGESTYVRPSVQVLAAAKEQDTHPLGSPDPSAASEKKASTTTTKKKEKPKTKEPIPDTVWLKVTTTAGNVFYTNVETKVSSWTVPDEIKQHVALYEAAQTRKADELRQAELAQARCKAEEAQRILEAEQRRIIDLEVQKVRAEVEAEAQLRGLKRKNEQPSSTPTAPPTRPNQPINGQTPAEPAPAQNDRQAKIPKLEPAAGDSGHDEEWQRQIAEEMAQEAAEQSGASFPQQPNKPPPPPIQQNTAVPAGLSLEELKATFKAMLLDKSIDPMAPWDNELPKFVTDARYLALPSMKERRDLFDEFCKEKIRQQRVAKQAVLKVDPPQAYRSLLIECVSSTRTLWEDFKSKNKKDPRFRSFGRDDRERERVFKGWLKELGEQKRQQLMKAEEDFTKLLLEKGRPTAEEEEYKDFKERVLKDPRFLAVTSNSSKEAMWKKWREESRIAAAMSKAQREQTTGSMTTPTDLEGKKREKQEASLKAREDQVRQMNKKLEKETAHTKHLVGHDEAEREFNSFLIDHVRDHDADWGDVRSQLTRDPRYESIRCLPQHELKAMFSRHADVIYSKRISALESFFEKQVRQPLTADFSAVKEKLLQLASEANDDAKVNEDDDGDGGKKKKDGGKGAQESVEDKLKVKQTLRRLMGGGQGARRRDGDGLALIAEKFAEWKSRKEASARAEFLEMFRESAFVDFWGRMKKAALDDSSRRNDVGAATIQQEGAEDASEPQMEGGGEAVDLREMAKAIDLREIHAIFRNDRRWIVWDHLPEQRDGWISTYLDQLAVPKHTVYQKDPK